MRRNWVLLAGTLLAAVVAVIAATFLRALDHVEDRSVEQLLQLLADGAGPVEALLALGAAFALTQVTPMTVRERSVLRAMHVATAVVTAVLFVGVLDAAIDPVPYSAAEADGEFTLPARAGTILGATGTALLLALTAEELVRGFRRARASTTGDPGTGVAADGA
jgi:predicted outer membrane lipoprotein